MTGIWPSAHAANGHDAAPPSSVMKSRRRMSAPSSGLGPYITTPFRQNAAVHHSKNCALMSQMGLGGVETRWERKECTVLRAEAFAPSQV